MPKKQLNRSLRAAAASKKDEFYTQLTDIEKELLNYKKHFKNKIILCNCDDPRKSNFFLYFLNRFEVLGLKGLITTCYKSQQPDFFSKNDSESGIYFEYFGEQKGKRVPDPAKIKPKALKGNGDFRSDECVTLLKKADIVVTNPPFSLFREYVMQLMTHKKKFVIIGNQNAITYKEIFKLFKEDKIWLGQSIHSGDREFGVPEYYPLNAAGSRVDSDGNRFIRVKGVRWFTNLDYAERHNDLILYKTYKKAEYPKFDHYDAINVNKTKDIPKDYRGAMGVPLTFLDKFSPEQFEIIDGLNRYSILEGPTKNTRGKYLAQVSGTPTYIRVVIRNKKI